MVAVRWSIDALVNWQIDPVLVAIHPHRLLRRGTPWLLPSFFIHASEVTRIAHGCDDSRRDDGLEQEERAQPALSHEAKKATEQDVI